MTLNGFSAKTFDPALHGELIAVRHIHHSYCYYPVERRVVSVGMLFEIGRHPRDRVRKVAGVEMLQPVNRLALIH